MTHHAYMNPSDLLSSRESCLTLRSKEDVIKSPLWFTEVMRRLNLKREYNINLSAEKISMIKRCPDCDKEKSFSNHLVLPEKNPVIVRCEDCQEIFDKSESKKRLEEKIKSEQMKIQVEASERERKFFQTLPSNILDDIKPMEIKQFSDAGYSKQMESHDMDKYGYSLLLSFFMSGMDRIELISHVDLVNKLRSAEKDIDSLVEFCKSREILIITDFDNKNKSDFSRAQVKNIILSRLFAKSKTFVFLGEGSSSTTEINFFEKIEASS